jgi:hypothetical protein
MRSIMLPWSTIGRWRNFDYGLFWVKSYLVKLIAMKTFCDVRGRTQGKLNKKNAPLFWHEYI